MSDARKTKLVKCPEPFSPLFAAAEDIMAQFFTGLQREPEKGEEPLSAQQTLVAMDRTWE